MLQQCKILREKLLKQIPHLKQVRPGIEDRTRQLKEEEAKLSLTKEKQRGTVGEGVSKLVEQVKVLEATIPTIRCESNEEDELQKEIKELKCQVENTAQCINDTEIQLEEEKKRLECEKNAKSRHQELGAVGGRSNMTTLVGVGVIAVVAIVAGNIGGAAAATAVLPGTYSSIQLH